MFYSFKCNDISAEFREKLQVLSNRVLRVQPRLFLQKVILWSLITKLVFEKKRRRGRKCDCMDKISIPVRWSRGLLVLMISWIRDLQYHSFVCMSAPNSLFFILSNRECVHLCFDVVIVIIMVIVVVVILTLKSVDEIIRCYYSNETCLSELLHRTIPDTIFRIYKRRFRC